MHCFIRFFHKTAEIFPLYFHKTAEILPWRAKSLDAVVPSQLFAANADAVAYQMEEYKNSGFIVILHCLKSF